ncbi:hypothetical protein ACFXB3_11140 [Streptomyces sp. NPDC059447]|uniref:hypothetical protein n=1 Tax=unclassified Streptomyces TaxID=2593676 RepID=UPI0036CAD9F1
MWSRYDGRTWTAPARIDQTSRTQKPVALTVREGKLHCLQIRMANGIHHNWYDGTSNGATSHRDSPRRSLSTGANR